MSSIKQQQEIRELWAQNTAIKKRIDILDQALTNLNDRLSSIDQQLSKIYGQMGAQKSSKKAGRQ